MLYFKIKKIQKKVIWLTLVAIFCIFAVGITNNRILAYDNPIKKPVDLGQMEVTYQNPLKVDSFTELISNFLTQVQGIIGWLAVIMIVVGGLVYITSTGRSSQITLGKKILTYALIGFALAVAAPSILKEIFDLASSGQGTASSNVIAEATGVRKITERVMNFGIALIGIIATIGFAISGILFVAAGGDSSKADKARKGLVYSIIGVTVAGAALIIVRWAFQLMGAEI